MPVLRSSSGQQSTIAEAFSRGRHPRSANKSVNASPSGSTTSRAARPKAAKRTSERPRPLPGGDVIEISSGSEDEDTQTCALQSTLINNLRERIEQLKDENERQKRDLEKLDSKAKVTLDVAIVEENLNCEICTGRMWSPYLLPNCGHTFCQSCLQDWFNTTLAKFTAEHPAYSTDWRHRARLLMDPIFMNNPNVLATLNATMPCYSCPTCRKIVHARPVEVYALKALVRSFASAAGEKSPQKESRARGSRKTSTNPWGHFFPLQDMA